MIESPMFSRSVAITALVGLFTCTVALPQTMDNGDAAFIEHVRKLKAAEASLARFVDIRNRTFSGEYALSEVDEPPSVVLARMSD